MTTLNNVTLLHKRGNEAARSAITPANGEIIIAKQTDNSIRIFVGDGATAGGVDPVSDLRGQVSSIQNTLALKLNTDDPDRDDLQEILDFIEEVQTAMTSGSAVVSWSSITSKPTAFPPSAHTHTKAEVGLGNVDNLSAAEVVATITTIDGGTF